MSKQVKRICIHYTPEEVSCPLCTGSIARGEMKIREFFTCAQRVWERQRLDNGQCLLCGGPRYRYTCPRCDYETVRQGEKWCPNDHSVLVDKSSPYRKKCISCGQKPAEWARRRAERAGKPGGKWREGGPGRRPLILQEDTK